jgi:hypothetical protein
MGFYEDAIEAAKIEAAEIAAGRRKTKSEIESDKRAQHAMDHYAAPAKAAAERWAQDIGVSIINLSAFPADPWNSSSAIGMSWSIREMEDCSFSAHYRYIATAQSTFSVQIWKGEWYGYANTKEEIGKFLMGHGRQRRPTYPVDDSY